MNSLLVIFIIINNLLLFVECQIGVQMGSKCAYQDGCYVGITTSNGNSDGAVCVLPFIYKQKIYNNSINLDYKGTNRYWCATTQNYDVDEKWGEATACTDTLCSYKTYGRGLSESINVNDPGADCQFPFKYQGLYYHKCLKLEFMEKSHLWCATTNDYDKDGLWAECKSGTTACADPNYKCSSASSSKVVCEGLVNQGGLTPSQGFKESCLKQDCCYDGTAYGGIYCFNKTKLADPDTSCKTVTGCEDTLKTVYSPTQGDGGGNALGATCKDYFIYKGQIFSPPTSLDSDRNWCAVTENYDTDHVWGATTVCTETVCRRNTLDLPSSSKDSKVTDPGKPCAEKYIYKPEKMVVTLEFSGCIRVDYTKVAYAWCATSYNYTKDLLWAECADDCYDVDECKNSETNLCQPNADCINTFGSYKCTCSTGFQPNGFLCDNIDECKPNSPCDANAICADNDGSYTCTCTSFYEGDGFTCTDKDECSGSPCDAQADCTNIEKGYICTCRTGFEGNGFTCTDIDECGQNSCDVNADCENKDGSYVCTCKSGFEGDGATCQELCAAKKCDSNAECIQGPEGAVWCQCRSGYDGDGETCTDVNECESSDICGSQESCSNTVGSYQCECIQGYSGQPCGNINECSDTFNPCGTNSACTDTAGSYTCKCESGFYDQSTDNKNCENIDECATANKCDINADCVDNIGSYTCKCRNSYTGDGETCFATCVGQIECVANANCVIQNQQRSCICNNGYSGVGTVSCTNIDECQSANECVNAICTDTPGSYVCVCKIGFEASESDSKRCNNIDECSQKPCTESADCTDTDGSYDCACKAGYIGDGFTCTEINECISNPCNVNAVCINMINSYECKCNNGYYGDGFNSGNGCTAQNDNIDECASSSTNDCVQNSNCFNAVGTYSCSCKTGFEGSGKVSCTNINECTAAPCPPYSTCQDTSGSYTCNCDAGYEKIGSLCIEINECLSNPCSSFATCSDQINSYGCTCINGYSGSGLTCTEINECNSSPCNSVATCTTLINGYECTCNSGYTGNGIVCSDVNECSTQNDCSQNAFCANTVGSYVCTCKTGYTGDGKTCIGAACQNNPCGSFGTCSPSGSSYACSCNSGYGFVSGTCISLLNCFKKFANANMFGGILDSKGTDLSSCLTICYEDSGCSGIDFSARCFPHDSASYPAKNDLRNQLQSQSWDVSHYQQCTNCDCSTY